MSALSGNSPAGTSRGGFVSMPYDSAFTTIVGKLKVQVFLFVCAISILLLGLAMIWRESAAKATPTIIAGGIVVLSLVAMVIYLLTSTWRRTETRARLRDIDSNAQPPLAQIVKDADRQADRGSMLSYDEFRYSKSISTTRAAMLLGAVLYAVYYLLDINTLHGPELNRVFLIRVTVCCAILLAWLFAFTDLFRRFEARIITSLCILAGLGILAMIATGGPSYYYEGLTLVIMFGAFVFGLPSRHLIVLCSTLILGYWLVTLRPDSITPGYILANNYFLLIAAILIAIAANRVLNRMSREAFNEALVVAEAKERQAAFFRLAARRLHQLHEDLKQESNVTSEGIPPAHQRLLIRLAKDAENIRGEMSTYLEAS